MTRMIKDVVEHLSKKVNRIHGSRVIVFNEILHAIIEIRYKSAYSFVLYNIIMCFVYYIACRIFIMTELIVP